MKTLIRRAQPQDCALLAKLAADTFTHNFGHLYKPENLAAHLQKTCSEQFFSQALMQKDTSIWLAFADDTLAGYCKLGELGLPVAQPETGAIELHRFYIDTPYQGSGLAQQLFNQAFDDAINQKPVYVGVWEENHRAQRFYQNYGFRQCGEYLYQVGDQTDRELIMLRPAA